MEHNTWYNVDNFQKTKNIINDYEKFNRHVPNRNRKNVKTALIATTKQYIFPDIPLPYCKKNLNCCYWRPIWKRRKKNYNIAELTLVTGLFFRLPFSMTRRTFPIRIDFFYLYVILLCKQK